MLCCGCRPLACNLCTHTHTHTLPARRLHAACRPASGPAPAARAAPVPSAGPAGAWRQLQRRRPWRRQSISSGGAGCGSRAALAERARPCSTRRRTVPTDGWQLSRGAPPCLCHPLAQKPFPNSHSGPFAPSCCCGLSALHVWQRMVVALTCVCLSFMPPPLPSSPHTHLPMPVGPTCTVSRALLVERCVNNPVETQTLAM